MEKLGMLKRIGLRWYFAGLRLTLEAKECFGYLNCRPRNLRKVTALKQRNLPKVILNKES
jgi:hypothetical protein